MRKTLIFMVLFALMLPGICTAVVKKPPEEVVKTQQEELKKRKEKIDELEKKLERMDWGPKKEKVSVELPCTWVYPAAGFSASSTIGWGVGAKDKNIQTAGATVLLATLISSGMRSKECLGETSIWSVAGIGPGVAFGGKYLKDKEAAEARNKTTSTVSTSPSTTTTSSGSTGTTVTTGGGSTGSSTVSTGGTGTTPGNGLPPPPPGAPRLSTQERRSNISFIPAFTPIITNGKTGWAGTVMFTIPLKKIPFLE